MKQHALVFSLWLLTVAAGMAQTTLPCNCERLAREAARGFEFRQAEAQGIVDRYSRHFYQKLGIIARPYACPDETAVALLCPPTEAKYIFYNQLFFNELERASGRGNQFLLAHEIAHHVLGHTARPYFMNPAQQAATSIVYRNDTLVAKEKNGRAQTYLINVPPHHLHELEADALGLWIVLRNGTTRRDIDQLFAVMPTLLRKDKEQASPTHPSQAMRYKLLGRQLAKLEKETYLRNRLSAAITDSTTTDMARLDLDEVANTIGRDTRGLYTFELVTADRALRQQISAGERRLRDSLDRRLWFTVDLVLGGQYWLPALAVDNQPVVATGGTDVLGGVRLNLWAWYKTHRVELDLLASKQTFTTQAPQNGAWRTTERFQTAYLYGRPRYVFSRMALRERNTYSSRGWMATAGLSINVPLAFQYENYLVPVAPPSVQQLTVGPVVGIGYGLSGWQPRAGHVRLWLLYQRQPLRFSPANREPTQAFLNSVSLEASFRFW